MNNLTDDNQQTKTGVYYHETDYAGLLQRVAIVVIDSIVIFLTVFGMNICWFIFAMFSVSAPSSFLLTWIFVAYFYLVVLKKIKLQTLGYLFTKTKIVNLKGEQPSWEILTYRFILLLFGPLYLISDIFWITKGADKQTLRDKIAGTYVINKDAQPLGIGSQITLIYDLAFFSLTMREVKRKA